MINIPNAILIILPISAYFTQPLVPGDFDWYHRMKCQHVTDKNQFPDFYPTVTADQIRAEFTWQKRMCFSVCSGWGLEGEAVRQYIKTLWFFLPDRKQTLLLLSAVRGISFRQGICQLSQFTLSICVCKVRFMVPTIVCEKSVVFCAPHSNEALQLCTSFSTFAHRKWNAPPYLTFHPVLWRWILHVP